MRNLKKLLAVILTVVMIASMMVPALAANTYEDEALKLQAINVFAGGPADLKLDEGVTRIQGLAFAIRAAGKDADALALTDAEVDAILADWTDADTIPAWGRKYAAYAIENGITVGLSATEKVFGAMESISGTSFLVFVMKSGMGYADVTTADVVDAAVEAGILTAGQAINFGSKAALIRDDAAGILYGAFTTGVNADGTKLIDAYIASGATTKEDAGVAGFVELAPATLEAVKASATNLKEIVVEFNTELDADTAKDKANYSVADQTIKDVRLNADKKSVTIELDGSMTNQSDFKVTAKTGVKSTAGVALADDKELSASVFDVTIPVALSAEQSGPTTFKVKFSEPVKAVASNYKVDGGTYFISKVESADNGYTVIVTLYATLPNGEHKVEVSGVEDYVPYKCVTKTLTFVAAKDEVAPAVAKVISASPEKVELEMTEDVIFVADEAAAKNGIYHTNSANKPDSVTIDGKKVTLTFTTSKLPNGTAYLNIAEELFKDSWGNKNEEVKDLALTVTVDKVKPTVKSIKAENDKQIVIEFSENIESGKGKFTLLDSTGKDVTKDYTISTTFADAKVTLDFNKALSGSTYSVVIEGIKDLAGNEIEKVSPTVSVTDTTAPEVTKAEIYKSKNVIKVVFNEVMKSEDILNLANYMLGDKYLSATKVTASLADNGKAVMLDYAKEGDDYDEFTTIDIGRVRDAAGNYIASFKTTKTLDNMDVNGIEIEKVEATGTKTLVVTLKDALSAFEPADFLINGDAVTDWASGVSFANNADGKGVITYTLDEELETDLATPIYVGTAATTASENSFGVKVKPSQANVKADDKISATITAAFTTADAITITFSEKIDTSTVSKASFTVSGNTVTSVVITDTTIVLNLKDAVAPGAKVTVTQVIDFEDDEGNVSSGLEVKDVEYTAP